MSIVLDNIVPPKPIYNLHKNKPTHIISFNTLPCCQPNGDQVTQRGKNGVVTCDDLGRVLEADVQGENSRYAGTV